MIDVEQLALQRSRYPDMSDDDFRFMLQQVDGRQRTARKLPAFAALDDWWYPVRLSPRLPLRTRFCKSKLRYAPT